MGCMIMELMEAIQESEGRAERMVLTVLEGEAGIGEGIGCRW